MAKLTYTGAEVQALLDKVNELATLSGVVTTDGDQEIHGIKNFVNGFKVGGAQVTYDSDKNAFVFPANAIFEGGLAWNASLDGFEPQTVTDAVMVDGTTIGRTESGALTVLAGAGGGIDEKQLANYLASNNYAKKTDTVANASALNNIGLADANGRNGIPVSSAAGYMEVGQALDFHRYEDGVDFSTRLRVTANNNNVVDLPSGTGVLALVSQIPTNTSQLANGAGYITASAIPTKISVFTNDSGYITGITSSMVTAALGYTPYNSADFTKTNIQSTLGISDWALAASKPSYAYSEISSTPSALPASDVYAWAKAATKPSYTATEVGALPITGGTLSGSLTVAGTAVATSVICGTESLRINAADSVSNFGYIRAETVASNRALVHIGGNYGSSSDVLNTSVRVDAIGMYRGVVGIGGTFTYDQLYSNYSNSIKLYVAGNIVATGEIAWNSSRVLKDIIGGAPTYMSLRDMLKIRPYRYTWKDKRDERVHAGGIADEVKEVLPEVIMTDAKGIHSMDYGQAAFTVATSLTPIVAELKRENRLLRKEITKLKRLIA